ncbi:MAG: argininosuccinate synthase [Candidatus Omnitrophica bacterium]|nr:argininosuccinate synthase [Candidatus Omnitrophota bacterium]MCF7894194.1 argininosuccinate synthase [Candidatus Omnitrophota bacterium]
MKKEKLILAYSGGLDTSCCLNWLKDKGFEVICFSANLGSEFLPKEIKTKAKEGGAFNVYVKDLREEFSKNYILPALKAGALYQNKYLLSTALGRPLIAKYLVEIARSENAKFVAHGCSAKGNDQIRLELAVKSLAPDLEIIAPLRSWELKSREEEIDYARKNKISVESTKNKIYSIDKNIWGVSIEAGLLEDLDNSVPEEAYILTKSAQAALDDSEEVEIEFSEGCPVKINKKAMEFTDIIESLNKIGGRHAIGRTDLIEDRVVGIKSREIYEAPAAWILHKALAEIEELVFTKDMLEFKEIIAKRYADLVYHGFWFYELKDSLDAFLKESSTKLTGKVLFKLYKGNVVTLKRSSKYSLYKKSLATYGKKDLFSREWAEGFINILANPFRRGK